MKSSEIAEYGLAVSALLEHQKVLEMELYTQHGSVSCLSHCLYVSWVSWRTVRLWIRP